MKNIEVNAHGVYRTIGNALGISSSLACSARRMSTNPRHEITNSLYRDLIAAQAKVLQKYQKKGLI